MFMITLFVLVILPALECHSTCIIVPLLSEGSHTCEVIVKEEEPAITLLMIPTAMYDTVVEFVARAISRDKERNCSEVIGVVGDLDVTTASIIHTLADRANLNITLVSAVAPSTFLPTTHMDLPNLLHMNPLTHYVEALAAFLDHLNWTRIGLISDDTPYYEFAAELIQQKLLQNLERKIIPFVRIREGDNKIATVQTFKEYNTDVIVISAAVKTSCSLLQEARRAGLTWPEYGWIILDYGLQVVENCFEEGVIILRDRNTTSTDTNYSIICDPQKAEDHLTFSNILLASIGAAQAKGFSFTEEFRAGRRLNTISIVQLGSEEEVGFYYSKTQTLSILHPFAGDQPRGTILKVPFRHSNATLHKTLVILIFLLLFVFVTAVLILYLYFRKEPEVKATSVTVSLFMFLGCYILISYLPLIVSSVDKISHFQCHLFVWFAVYGMPFTLILATIFVKMLRIYLILSDPLSIKKWLFTDPFLTVYILLLVSPSFLLLLVWSNLDPRSARVLEYHKNNFIMYGTVCTSILLRWAIGLLLYPVILSTALVGLALKTSKVRYRHFGDTRATNVFVYLSCFISLILLWYYGILLGLGFDLDISVYIAHASIPLTCQFLLFVPKVFPPLKRRFTHRKSN